MAKQLKRYVAVFGQNEGVHLSPNGNLLARDEVIAAIKRRIRTERGRANRFEAGTQGRWRYERAIAALEALLERLGEKT
jgi:hypothetical protein